MGEVPEGTVVGWDLLRERWLNRSTLLEILAGGLKFELVANVEVVWSAPVEDPWSEDGLWSPPGMDPQRETIASSKALGWISKAR